MFTFQVGSAACSGPPSSSVLPLPRLPNRFVLRGRVVRRSRRRSAASVGDSVTPLP